VSGGTALVVASASDPDAGHVGDRLEELGYRLQVVHRDDELMPRDAAAVGPVDVAVLLGSDWSVADPLDHDHVARECALVRSLVERAVPMLGICYGAQLVAHALGGSVARAPRAEVGWVDVRTDVPDLVPHGPWAAFHTDVIAPPPGAEVVARNACGVQAYTLPGVLAVQFHPEVRAEVLDGWAARYPGLLAECGLDRAALAVDSARYAASARRRAHALVDAFLAREVTQRRPGRVRARSGRRGVGRQPVSRDPPVTGRAPPC
jgi:GMP synthase (glutamine-hydrolysing)